MDITPRKHAKVIALNEHTSMTIRDIAMAVGVEKSSVSRILWKFQDSGIIVSKKGGENVGENIKQLQELKKF